MDNVIGTDATRLEVATGQSWSRLKALCSFADECQVKSCALCNEPAEPGDRFCAACGAPIVEITPVSGSDGVAETGARHDESEASIRSIVAAQVVAWDAGDGHAYARHLAADVSFTNFGMVAYGASAFAQRHAEILATFYRGTTKHHLVHRIRFVTPDVAIVDIDSEVHGVTAMPEGITVPPDGIVRTQLMEVFVRRDDRWWIEAYHSVDVKCARRDSNPQPSDPKSEALSIELRTRRP